MVAILDDGRLQDFYDRPASRGGSTITITGQKTRIYSTGLLLASTGSSTKCGTRRWMGLFMNTTR